MSEDKEGEQVKSNGAESESAGELIGRANAAAERLEKANQELAKLLAKQERMKVADTLGGHAEAGIKPKEKTQEEKEVEEAKAWLAGSGMEDDVFSGGEE